jgi:hypothetical protein
MRTKTVIISATQSRPRPRPKPGHISGFVWLPNTDREDKKGSEPQHAISREHLAVQPNPSFEARPNIKTLAPRGGAGYHPPRWARVLLSASASIQTLGCTKEEREPPQVQLPLL